MLNNLQHSSSMLFLTKCFFFLPALVISYATPLMQNLLLRTDYFFFLWFIMAGYSGKHYRHLLEVR